MLPKCDSEACPGPSPGIKLGWRFANTETPGALCAQGQFDTTRVFVSLVLLGVMGTILFYAVDVMERIALPWHSSQRQPNA